jgi:predicted extracellular nuclease
MRPRRSLAALATVLAASTAGVGLATAASAAPTDLLISEYVEGSSFNKAIELYNGTGAAIDLAAGGYQLQLYFNGSTTATPVALTGTVAAGDVFVLAQSTASADVLSRADQTTTTNLWNGDDAIVLRRGTTVLDSIGQVGVDPGTEWGTGLTSTADNTLRRQTTVASGDTDPSDAFDPAAGWVGFATDTFDGLGAYGTGAGEPTPTPTTSGPAPSPTPTPSPTSTTPPSVLTVGQVQGPTTDAEDGAADRSPLAPATGNGGSTSTYDVRGVITQRVLSRTSAGEDQYGFYLQSRRGATDGDPTSSDGIFVFTGRFTTLIGGYEPTVGDEVVLRAKVAEYFNMTQLTSATLVEKLASGLNPDTDVEVADATPPADTAAAARYWERVEGARMRVRAGSTVTSPRDVFGSTADSEIYVLDRDDPLLKRDDPYARRVFRDAHPLDNDPRRFDDGNAQRILLSPGGVKWAAKDSRALLPPVRTFDPLTADSLGAVNYAFSKYTVQVENPRFGVGPDPAANNPPQAADRSKEVAVATFNLENLYDFRDDPFDGCDFTGNAGCDGVKPPFDYVPASEQDYTAHLTALADQIVGDLKSPDLIMVQEAEDQDICTVTGSTLSCGTTNDADGKPDTVQELALAVAAKGGPVYDTAFDRTGADARGIVSAFLFRTDRISLAQATATDPLLGSAPTVQYRAAGLPSNADVQNPKGLNAVLPSDVDASTGLDGANVFTRAAQVGKFFVKAFPGSTEGYTLWAVTNHYSSGPDRRIGQRREQATYGAAIMNAIKAADPTARAVYGGDLNVFPRPDDPIATADNPTPSDQLAPLYEAGLHNLWDDLVADVPAAAYSYVFSGQAQTLDNLFVNDALHADLVQDRVAHINADYPADFDGDGARGASDHDPQVARFRSRATLSVADVAVAEGDSGITPMTFTARVSRPLSQPVMLCAAAVGLTASAGQDFQTYAGCKTLAAGQTSVDFVVNVRGDRRIERNEQVSFVVGGMNGLRLGDLFAHGTITNDD